MIPPYKKAINPDYLSFSKKPVKKDNSRQKENKKDSKSSESYEQTNITELSVNQKRKKQFQYMEKTSSESEDNERENKFLGKKTNNVRESKVNKRNENKDRTSENAVEREKNKKLTNITLISIDDSDINDDSEYESDNARSIGDTEIINSERKERTIFAKSSKQKITESTLTQIFKKYGTISKFELISDYSALVEFINKT